MRKMLAPSWLALVLVLASPAALAAPDDGKLDAAQTQAPDDSKSYLPPWMQKTAGPEAGAGSPVELATESASLENPGDPAAKSKPLPGQRAQRKHRNGTFWPAFGSIWR